MTLYNNLKEKVSFFVNKLSLNQYVNQTGRKLALSITNILSLALFKHFGQILTKKKLWEIFKPNCSYKTLVVNVNKFFTLALKILFLVLKSNKNHCHLVKHIDSADIPVCSNRKVKHCSVMRNFAAWGKSGKGWFYGLKMHLIADLDGRILAIKFTSGNINDRAVVIDLADNLNGIFVAGTGYVSQDLAEKFHREKQRILLAKPRANMKKLASMFETYLYGTRMRIEINFKNLKQFFGLLASLPRSAAGYLANYACSLLAYCLR